MLRLVLLWLFLCRHCCYAYPETIVWFNKSATQFEDTILLGNGKLGASVWGNVTNDRLALNEETLWAGGPYDPANANASQYIPVARDLVNKGDYLGAQDVLQGCMATPIKQTQYQTTGSLLLNITEDGSIPSSTSWTNYRRELDLTTAVTTTSYTLNGVNFTRRAFVSTPLNVLVVHLSTSEPGSLNVSISLATPTPLEALDVSESSITLSAKNTDAENAVTGVMTYQDRLKIFTDGGTSNVVNTNGPLEAHVRVQGAGEVTLILGIATSFVNYDDGSSGDPSSRLDSTFSALPSSLTPGGLFDTLLSGHVEAYGKYFSRFSIDLGNDAILSALPTDMRIARGMQESIDPGLISLFINFGRYLLISSSQPGNVQPANLQGIWQYNLTSSWQSKFTVNINIEMNYWPAESTSLPDTIEPLLRLLEDVSVTGRRTAQIMYNVSTESASDHGLPPWVLHHNTDQWRATAPVDSAYYGYWPAGGAWQLQTLWEHFQFNPSDKTFAERIYPLFQGASQFFLETLQVHPNNTEWLVTNPSMSPEKAHHSSVSIALGPTLDNSLLRDLFDETAYLAKFLGIDAEFVTRVTEARNRLPPFLISSGGALQEWLEDWEPKLSAFTHISPMYSLFPGAQIDSRVNSTLADAAQTFLTYKGDGTFGWPVAWRIGTWARLLDANHALTEIKLLLSDVGVYESLLGKNKVFQIDANLGGIGGMVEMFLQSHNGEIHLLPAVPSELPEGKITGLRARGGFNLNITWSDNILEQAVITATISGAKGIMRLAGGEKTLNVDLQKGESKAFSASDFS